MFIQWSNTLIFCNSLGIGFVREERQLLHKCLRLQFPQPGILPLFLEQLVVRPRLHNSRLVHIPITELAHAVEFPVRSALTLSSQRVVSGSRNDATKTPLSCFLGARAAGRTGLKGDDMNVAASAKVHTTWIREDPLCSAMGSKDALGSSNRSNPTLASVRTTDRMKDRALSNV